MEFKLVSTTTTKVVEKGKTYDEKTYVYSDGKRSVKFYVHPTKAFEFVVLASDDPKLNRKVLMAFVKAGMRQHEVEGGFEAAIATLTV